MNSDREWLAALALNLVDKNNFSARRALDRIIGEVNRENQALRSTINALILETIRRKNIIDRLANFVLDDTFRSKENPYPSLKRLDSKIKNFLRIMIYRLKFEKHPSELVQKSSKRILQEVHRNFVEIFDIWITQLILIDVDEFISSIEDPIDRIALHYWQPYYLVNRFTEVFGEKAIDIFEYFQSNSPVFIRINNLKDKEITFQEFNKYNVALEPDKYMDDVFKVIKSDVPMARLDGFKRGYFYIQSRSSCFISHFLTPHEDEKILDTCAAPGSKTTHIASLTNDKTQITAMEVDTKRISMLKKTLDRCAVKSVTIKGGDAREMNFSNESFDKILIDAPCSGSGTLSTKTYAKWRIKNSLVKRYSQLQYEILNNVSQYLKIGGLLLYSTCSLLPEENEDIISKFLNEHADFEPVELIYDDLGKKISFKGRRLIPNEVDSEGFSLFLLRKKKVD